MVYHPNEFETAVTLGQNDRSTVMYQTLSQRVWRVRDYAKGKERSKCAKDKERSKSAKGKYICNG